ncbi:MAG: fused MFS/spermidine synthase [Chromatiales bacterium]|jgi:spermidine synthase|nr:fused MFS/spermidine synthase [Chromatiales bacterium]
MVRRLLPVLYAGSGATSLAFEVLWARMLSMQFGVSIFGVVVTIAAFMAGLGLGSLLAIRWLGRRRQPLLIFSFIEGSIALYALVLPWLLGYAEKALTVFAPDVSLSAWLFLQGGALLFLMLLPAIAMGAGFPMILRAMGADDEHALGRLYGFNACGAAIGALLPLWLLPAFGWTASIGWIAALGLLVAGGAALLAWSGARTEHTSALSSADALSLPLLALFAYGVVGAAAILLEVGWTRLYGMVLLRTEYVMAVILAVYLFGIGLGSLLARHMRSSHWLSVLPMLAAATGIASLYALPWISSWAQRQEFSTLAAALWSEGIILAVVTLPATFVLGSWLPLLSQRYGGSAHGPLLYGINSIGAALGALVAGLLLVPTIGTPATIVVGAVALLVAAMVWASRVTWLALPVVLVLASPVAVFPPVSKLMPAQQESHDLYRYEDAMAITHVIEQSDGQRLLLSDLQRMDASSEQAAVELQKNQARLPLLLHPDPHSILFLGLGTGVSAAGSLGYPALDRVAVELSAGAIEAARLWFKPVNGNVGDYATIVRDDARRYLSVSSARFDVIVGDVFHPDLVGRSALLSVQQFERARARLAPGGVFVQWLALNQFDIESLQTVLRSFEHVFPDAAMFMDGFRIAMVGGLSGVDARERLRAVQERISAESSAQSADQTGGEGLWTWLGRYCGRVVIAEGPMQDEWWPRIEFGLPHARYGGGIELDVVLSWLLQQRPSLASAMKELGVDAADERHFERGYSGSALALRAWLASINSDMPDAQRLIRSAFEVNPQDRWVGFALADNVLSSLGGVPFVQRRQVLEALLRARPDHADTLRMLWQMARDTGDAELAAQYLSRLSAVNPLDREVRTATQLGDAVRSVPGS